MQFCVVLLVLGVAGRSAALNDTNGTRAAMSTLLVDRLREWIDARGDDEASALLIETLAVVQRDADIDQKDIDYDSGNLKNPDGSMTDVSAIDVVKQAIVLEEDPAVMHYDEAFMSDLSVLFLAATMGAYIAHHLRAPVTIGWMAGGCIVGVNSFAIVSHIRLLETFSVVGSSLVMFCFGMRFSQQCSVWAIVSARVVIPAVSYLLAASISIGAAIKALGLGSNLTILQSSVIGLFAALSSSNSWSESVLSTSSGVTFVPQIGAILLVHDLLLQVLTVLPSIDGVGTCLHFIKQILFCSLLTWGFLQLTSVLTGSRVGRLLRPTSPVISRLLLVSIALGASKASVALDMPAELGAFIAGGILQMTRYGEGAIGNLETARDVFATLLFSSFGMLLSPAFIAHNLAELAIVFFVMHWIKFVLALLLVRTVCRVQRWDHAITHALLSSQSCEISFIVAGKAYAAHIIPRHFYLIHLTTCIASTAVVPVLIQIVQFIRKRRSAYRGKDRPRIVSLFEGATDKETAVDICE